MWVRVWESKKRCSCCCSNTKTVVFFLSFFFFSCYICICACTRTWALPIHVCIYARALRTHDRRFDILTVRFTIRNNICILFCLYFFHLFSIFSPMFRHFLVMVNCAGYISLYTIHNIHIICIRYNTCIIYSESIYLSERVIHRSAVLVDTRVLTLMTNYNCVCTFYIYVQSLTWPNMWSSKTITQNITSHVMILRGKPSFIDHFCAVCVIKTAIKIHVRIQCSW